MLIDTPNLIQWTDPADAAFTIIGVAKDTNHTTIDSFGTAIRFLKPLDLSAWLTAQRPALDASGHVIGFASDTGQLELWDGIQWSQVLTSINNGLGYTPVNKAGDTMTGALAMGANALSGSNASFTGGTLTGLTHSGGTFSGSIAGTPTFSGTKFTLGSGSGGFTLDGTGSTGNLFIKTGGALTRLQDSSGADVLRLNKATTAVNWVNLTNAATLGRPIISAGGSDTDVGLTIRGQGAGQISVTSPINLTAAFEQTNFTATFAGSDPGTAGTTLGAFFGQTFSGTTSATADLNRWTITDAVSTTASGLNGWKFIHNMGAVDGSRRMLQILLNQTANTGPDVAFFTVLQPQIGMGHDLAGGGVTETINTNHNLKSGATNSPGQLDIEQDISAQTGSGFMATAGRFGIGTFLTDLNTVAAPNWDTAYMIAVGPSTDPTNDVVAWRTIWQFGKGASQPVVDTTIGQFLDVYPQTTANASSQPMRPIQALRGFNLSKYNFTDAGWWSPGLRLAAAEIDNGGLRTYQGTNGPIIDAAFSTGAVSSFTAGGLGYAVGDQVPDRLGGILSIDTINGSGHPLTWHYITPPYSRSGAAVIVATGINTVAGVNGDTILNVGNRLDFAVGDTVLSPSTSSIPAATKISSITSSFNLTTSTDTPSGLTLTTTNTTGVVVNAQITGPNMPLGAKIVSFVANTSITLNTAVLGDVPSGSVLAVGPFIGLSAALTGAVAAQSPLQFQMSGLSTTVPMPVGGTGNGGLVATVAWTAPTLLQLGASVNTVIGTGAAGATTDTSGHLMIPFCAGSPTGIPTNASSAIALRYDTTNHKLWAYDNAASAWKGVALT